MRRPGTFRAVSNSGIPTGNLTYMANDDFYDDGIELSVTQAIVARVIAAQEKDPEVGAAIARMHAEACRSGWDRLEDARFMFEHPAADCGLERIDHETLLREWDAEGELLQ